LVQNNQVSNTTGTTVGSNPDVYGIKVAGSGARLLNNDVTDSVGVGTGSGHGIYLSDATGAVVEGNRIGNAVLAMNNISYGINAFSGSDILVVGNRLATVVYGLFFSGANGRYRDNLTSGTVTNPYTGGDGSPGNNQ
jgi:nitrous oxidase accessory protein NosD